MENIYSCNLIKSASEQWDDFLPYWHLKREKAEVYPKAIHIWHGEFLDKIQVEYEGKSMPQHGGSEPGGYVRIELNKGEYIKGISADYMPFGCSLRMIHNFEVTTSQGRTLGFHGWGNVNNCERIFFNVPDGHAAVAFGGTVEPYYTGGNLCVSGLTIYYKEINPQKKNLFNKSEQNISGVQIDTAVLNNGEGVYVPKSDTYINMVTEINVKSNCQLLCASISTSEHEVAMPNGVSAVLYDSKSNRMTENNDSRNKVVIHDGSFYQMYIIDPAEEQYILRICAKIDAKCYFEAQMIYENALKNIEKTEDVLEEQFEPGNDNFAALARPVSRAIIVDTTPEAAISPQGSRQAQSFWTTFVYLRELIKWFFRAYSGYILVAAIIVFVIAIFVKLLNKGKNKNDIKKEAMPLIDNELRKEIEKKLMEEIKQWANIPKGQISIYTEVESYEEIYKETKENPSNKYTMSSRTKELWISIYEKNNGNMKASQMKMIEKTDIFSDNILCIDIGGEGCFTFGGINSGTSDALNFNGKTNNSQYKRPIPMLIHFSDWMTEKFPIQTGIVDRFIMQGTGTPTLMQATEMIRCLSKKKGSRMDFWVADERDEACYRAMAEVLQANVENEKVEFKCWSEDDVEYIYKKNYGGNMTVYSIYIK